MNVSNINPFNSQNIEEITPSVLQEETPPTTPVEERKETLPQEAETPSEKEEPPQAQILSGKKPIEAEKAPSPQKTTKDPSEQASSQTSTEESELQPLLLKEKFPQFYCNRFDALTIAAHLLSNSSLGFVKVYSIFHCLKPYAMETITGCAFTASILTIIVGSQYLRYEPQKKWIGGGLLAMGVVFTLSGIATLTLEIENC